MFLVIEGADGSGKTEVGKAVARDLGATLIHFPDDTAKTGPMIRSYLRKGWHIDGEENTDIYDPMAFQALQIVNRLEHMDTLRHAAGHPTFHVVAVRYWQSGWVYGQLDGLNPDWIEDLHATLVQPDASILLDVNAGTSMERRAARDGDLAPERYEGKLDLTAKVVGLYRDLWNTRKHYVNWRIVDAMENDLDGVSALVTEYALGLAAGLGAKL